MKVTVLGCGRWGSFHAWYAEHIGHEVWLWGRESSQRLRELQEKHCNEYLTLPESIVMTSDLAAAVERAEVCIISVSSQQLRSFAGQLAKLPGILNKKFILCMKGLEIGSGKRLTTVMEEVLGPEVKVAVWVGPGHVQDFLKGIPNCMVMAARDLSLTTELVEAFGSELIRFYYGEDLLGIEIGAAAKNVVGLAAGMLDGAHYASLKGALMARGTSELSRLIEAMGGSAMTVYGLSHLGDYEATLFSAHSNNRRYGENLMLGQPSSKLAEGVYTVEALMQLSEAYQVELPISEAVHRIVCKHENPQQVLTQLFLRSVKME